METLFRPDFLLESVIKNFGTDSSTLSSAFKASPILSRPDFNGDGIVNLQDVFAIQFHRIFKPLVGEHAIFDVNADGRVDRFDVRATLAAFGQKSSELDLQLAEIYRDVSPFLSEIGHPRAILDGYGAFTPAFQGHGEHWVNPSRVAQALSKPKEELTHMDYIGLNVEPYGGESLLERDVLGVFYLIQPDNIEELWGNFVTSTQDGDEKIDFGVPEYEGVPDLFKDDPLLSPHQENWHRHDAVYIHYPNPLDPKTVTFEQNLDPHELYTRYAAATLNDPNNELVVWGLETGNGFAFEDIADANVMFLPSFQMMHAWVNAINPSEYGAFGETHPLVSPNAPPLDSHGGHHSPIV